MNASRLAVTVHVHVGDTSKIDTSEGNGARWVTIAGEPGGANLALFFEDNDTAHRLIVALEHYVGDQIGDLPVDELPDIDWPAVIATLAHRRLGRNRDAWNEFEHNLVELADAEQLDLVPTAAALTALEQ